ncbi:hypothetical protein LOZ61_000834 [Ophidiomyces ophidiicola]|uniref:uncharacterized protein n=1 Tax=Ophidiomyces ophidiicola TaxID=1387563 RepID=UPI0020C4F49D|nr:uncharacterized protein LOZ57_001151 [Ophidiomyces ophidiicola]KAI1916121.1 hypothetical protein LOZ64_003384 [Ophidiomyces ophidiicola]KAI1916931.1 hypothetical protein LOZ61_000834 [Ophidiomyces ophidiicola]KAI1924910.1 hypothetical protein LOZ60_004434 [Ophidiomyces ophidiicola]KAI1948678.1 hypothetical protein LOZ62_002627 [Ophidiomyces ophidiicola]KAI1951739.1 hypothetical protein LOZ57_001151 [Ophidiomyces ophidiicola]
MPGLTVVDGTPRGCASAACGAQKDTSIIRDAEMGSSRASTLGRTSYGAVDPAAVMQAYMGRAKTRRHAPRQLLNNLASAITGPAGAVLNGFQDIVGNTPLSGVMDGIQGGAARMGGGQMTPKGVMEGGVGEYSGKGQSAGLPTAASDGTITMTYHQVNQDGAGPLTAEIDPSSGGSDPKAFQKAQVIKNVPGAAGFSTASNSDYEIQIKMPDGMKCTGELGGAKNVCVARVRNTAISGPFGGGAAFTQ